MDRNSPNPPYFDVLFDRIAAGDQKAVTAFGHHVHWGCWEKPDSATGSATEYQEAAERLCQRVCEAADIDDGQRIVDVGCGFGGTIASLNRQYDRLVMTGINIDARQLQRAREHVIPRSSNQITWVEADAASLPLKASCCDTILAVECIFHFDRQRFLAEAARVLHSGGQLTISDFVPVQRMADFLGSSGFAGSDAVRWSYGQVDMTCSIARYQQLARDSGLRLTLQQDLTAQTLPTYEFLRQNAERWQNAEQAELFRQATGWLERASRKNMIRYMILGFTK